ncbi:MAG: hypothetical protein Q9222_002270 [Ikaeria aurantiellina]
MADLVDIFPHRGPSPPTVACSHCHVLNGRLVHHLDHLAMFEAKPDLASDFEHESHPAHHDFHDLLARNPNRHDLDLGWRLDLESRQWFDSHQMALAESGHDLHLLKMCPGHLYYSRAMEEIVCGHALAGRFFDREYQEEVCEANHDLVRLLYLAHLEALDNPDPGNHLGWKNHGLWMEKRLGIRPLRLLVLSVARVGARARVVDEHLLQRL